MPRKWFSLIDMTTIERLGISGIRSYGTEKETFLRFSRPLTIILGRNGSGKSSIIESILQATTGQLPPMVGTGAAFIHDPRIDNETETKAKIRLQFTNARGDQYIVSRHFQLSMKRTTRGSDKLKLEFKRLDQTLKRITDEGKSAAKPFRCADLNAFMPEIMRVSVPILTSVIFVHQEESLWPLGDPRKLKEKFDDIFAATRYTKALESIRKYRKANAQELKVINVELQHFESRVKFLDELKEETSVLREKQASLKRGSQGIEGEIAQVTKELEAAEEVVEEYGKKHRQHSQWSHEIQVLESLRVDLKSNMDKYLKDLGDHELQAELENSENRLESIHRETEMRKAELEQYRAKKEQLDGALKRKVRERADYEAQIKSNEVDMKALEEMKTELYGRFVEKEKVSVPLSLDATNTEWSASLGRIVRNSEQTLAETKVNCRKEEENANIACNQAKIKLQSEQENLLAKKDRLRAIDSEIPVKRSSIVAMGDVQAKYEEAKESENAAKKQLEERERMGNVTELTKKKNEKESESNGLFDKLNDIREIRDRMERDRKARMQVDMELKTVSGKRQELKATTEVFRDTILAAWREVKDAESIPSNYVAPSENFSFDRLRNADLDDDEMSTVRDDLQEGCQNLIERKEALISHATNEVNNHMKASSTAKTRKRELDHQLSSMKRKLGQKERELAKARDKLRQLPTPESLPELDDQLSNMFQDALVLTDGGGCTISADRMKNLEDTLKSIDKKKTNAYAKASVGAALPTFWQSLIDRFENDPRNACPACGLSAKKKVESQRDKLNSELEKSKNPETTTKLQSEARNLEKTVEALKQVCDIGSSVVASSETYLPLNENVKNANEEELKCTECEKKAREEYRRVTTRLGGDSFTNKLGKVADDVNRLEDELKNAERKLSDAQNKLPVESRNERTMEDIVQEVKDIEQRIQELNSETKRLMTRIQREQEEIVRLQKAHTLAMNQTREMQEMGEKFRKAKEEVKALKTESRKLDSEIQEIEPKVQEMELAVENANMSLVTIQAEQDRLVDIATRKKSETTQVVHEFNQLSGKISHFETMGIKQSFRKLLEHVEEMEGELNEVKGKVTQLEKEGQDAGNSWGGLKSAVNNLKTNIAYREKGKAIQEKKAEMEELRNEIDKIRKQVQGGDPQGVVVLLQERIKRLNKNLIATVTKITMLTEEYKKKKVKLEAAEREGSRKKYDECRITKQTMELASIDLDKYHRALDQALMAFHTLKMNSINRIIKELWQQTYRGSDIDEIEIGSDAGDVLGGSSSAGKRNYNYRVVMRQGQAQLDMRGRCSAGQKVLACLVIRLALAESFCTDCGILALDEPTTNLDTENIESLATALKTIIEIRRKQRNFQLVLITHDRDFIDMIGAREFTSEYFMIHKDANGKSHAQVKDLVHLPE